MLDVEVKQIRFFKNTLVPSKHIFPVIGFETTFHKKKYYEKYKKYTNMGGPNLSGVTIKKCVSSITIPSCVWQSIMFFILLKNQRSI